MPRQRIAILVAGMHRSGTSALSRVLNLVGCDLPKTLKEAVPDDNETGFWESGPISELNRDILASAGSGWTDWRPFDPSWYDSPVADGFRERAQVLLREEFGDSRLFVLKDPLICRLLPFWIEEIRTAGAEPRVISPIRNPLDVAASLKLRNTMGATIAHLLWLRHVLDCESASRGVKRAYCRYETLLSDSPVVVDQLGRILGVSWPKQASESAQLEIETFLSPGLRHHRAGDSALLANPTLSHWITSSFVLVDRWSREEAHDTDTAVLDEVRSAFDEAIPIFSRAMAEGEQAVAERDGRIDELNEMVVERDGWLQASNQAVAERDGRIDGLNEMVAERDGWLQASNQAVAERDGWLQASNQAVAERDERIRELYASTSWRITAPLRHLGRAARLVLAMARAGLSRIARTVYRRTPLPPSAKIRLRGAIFRLVPALFRRTGAYRDWQEIKRSTVSREKGQDRISWGILTTPHTLFVANSIERRLREHGWNVHLMTEPPGEFSCDFYVVICPQIFKRLPPYERLISFQMEQSVSSRWFNERYLDILHKSYAVLEYAIHNFPFLKDKDLSFPHVYYLPIGGEHRHHDASLPPAKTCDVLFYGDNLSSPRRLRMLSALKKKFEVRVENNTFFSAIEESIRSARVVVNIHYYNDALLEVPRIWECLSLGTPVVSESAKDQGDYPELDGVVKFFEQDSISSMLLAVEEALENPVSEHAIYRAVDMSNRRFTFMFDRFLMAMNFLPSSYANEIDLLVPKCADRIILSMPETYERRYAILSERRLDRWTLFDGLRRQPSWIGCGLSYYVLARHALYHGMDSLVVAEDDVFLPEDFSERFETVERYLDQRTDQWTMFCGLISDLHNEVNILSVDHFEGRIFVTIDKMTSTVFNIYNRKSLQMLASWNFDILDPHLNTIDRFIENHEQLRIVVTVPFLVRQSDNLNSILWGFDNNIYSKMIMESESKLQKLVEKFVQSETNCR